MRRSNLDPDLLLFDLKIRLGPTTCKTPTKNNRSTQAQVLKKFKLDKGYRHREDVDKGRKIRDFPGCSFSSPHRFYYFISYFTIQRDIVITLMETSPPTVPIPDIPDPLFFA
ncbi:hypothetical protein PIB30_012626 [Stylosanthes scabra]|uniref:Uncharacterized protein n=1 Tax=Stylosanthes scabra TaxID=79078 RepID=A0ABU6Y511_9FABA|nr:hypothetical protein [Stylosanthes scabra]